MGRGITGILTGFCVWAFLWWSLHAVLPLILPKLFRSDGTTDNLVVNILIILLSFDFSFIAGYINAIIAKAHEHRFVFIQGLLQLSAAIYVQRSYWELVPLWFHLSFLALILPGVLAGATWRVAGQLERVR